MRRYPRLPAVLVLSLPLALLLAGAGARHLELLDSHPRKDQTMANPPVDISLIFSESAAPDSSSVTLSGSSGEVALGPIRAQDEGLVLMARVEGEMPAGGYTVVWRAGAPGAEPASGSYRFTVGRGR